MIVLTETIVQEIAQIGRDRMPAEACGVLLPEPWRDHQVWEMPNRSKTPHDSFELHGTDVGIQLEGLDRPEEWWDRVAIWHTHPKGNLGPSQYDMQNRLPDMRNLVVSLTKGDAKATWY